MRIAFITHWFDPEGGAAAGPGIIARALAERGHEIHVVTGYPIYPDGEVFDGYSLRLYSRELMDGMIVHRFPTYPSHDSTAFKRFANYCTYSIAGAIGAVAVTPRLDCAFVYSTPATAAFPGVTLRALRKVPFVVQIQDLWPQTVTASGMLGPRLSPYADRLLNPFCDLVYRSANRIAVTSPGMAELIAARGINRGKITVVPNWADEESFRPVSRDQRMASQLGLTAKTVVMYAGNFGVMQDLTSVIHAAEQLQDLTDLQIALVGAGVMKRRLEQMVREKSLDNVVFVPPQPFDRMAEVLALGDAQLVTLKTETLFRSTTPSKLQANMAAGRPIIGAVAGDAAAVIEDSKAGFVATPGDATALAMAIRMFHQTSSEERSRMERNALAYYTREFSKDRVVARLEALLQIAAARVNP